MKITIESTSKLIKLQSGIESDSIVPARVWEGFTESGIKVHCFITRIAVDKNETRTEEFTKELSEQKVPSPEIETYPLRLIL